MGGRGIAPTIRSLRVRSGLAVRPGLFTPGKDSIPIAQEAGWASGQENLAPHRHSLEMY